MKNDHPPRLKKDLHPLKSGAMGCPAHIGHFCSSYGDFLEHTLSGELELDPYFISEIIIFSVVGPAIVAFIIVWMCDYGC